MKDLAHKLEQAGLSRENLLKFKRKQWLFALCGLALGVGFLALGGTWFLPLALASAGYILPKYNLESQIQKRKREIVLGLPYYLDILTLALEAGLDLIASLEELIEKDSPNALKDELSLTLKTIRMGESRSQAFLKLADRTGVEALALLASSISHSEELGASLGSLFRLQAESLRREISRDAEARAQRAPVKMLLPLIGLIFPVLFLLLFTPIALRLMSGN